VHRLLNYNTRLTLLVLLNYVASGHVDIEGLLRAMKTGHTPRSLLTWHKVLGAMMLGTRSVYESHHSWLWNIWNDERGDRTGVLIQARLLRLLHLQKGEVAERLLTNALTSLFGYSHERVRETLARLKGIGLLDEDLHEQTGSCFCISEAGKAYLQIMTREFEYLQHIAVDVPVDERYLVKCTTRDEPASVRFDRVLNLARWLRELEVAELAQVIQAGQLGKYERYYQDDTISASLASTLSAALKVLPKSSGQGWDELRAGTDAFVQSASYAALLAEARSRPPSGELTAAH
jgi:hypothetical protein